VALKDPGRLAVRGDYSLLGFANCEKKNMLKKILSFVSMAAFAAAIGFYLPNTVSAANTGSKSVEMPLNLAVLIQDDVVSKVGNEIGVTKDFVRSLPAGSKVMVGYIRSGSLEVRQPFTSDLDLAAKSLRIPIASEWAAPYNPYVEVIEAIKKFDPDSKTKNAILLISDGLDTSRGFDAESAGHTVDIERAIKIAKRANVAVYSFYTPTVGLTSRSFLAASYGQSSLARISDETGGKAFFQGTTGFVTFDPYFDQLWKTLNDRYGRAG
jgi:hypothetical protein